MNFEPVFVARPEKWCVLSDCPISRPRRKADSDVPERLNGDW
jgi:hypothetical protein